MDMYSVYKHTTPSGKAYIGITKQDAKRRWKYGYGYKHNKHFFNAIMKYGWDNIMHQIIASDLSLDEACTLEKELIAHYTQDKMCYNVAEGGQDGNTMKRTEEEKQHLSDFFKEYFKTHDPAMMGKHHTEESITKMKKAQKKRWEDNYQNMYNALIVKVKIGAFNTLTGEYKEYDSEKEASSVLNIKPSTLRRHVNNGVIINNMILIPLDAISFEEALQKAYIRDKSNIHCGGQEIEVVQLDLNGNYIYTYPSAKQAALETKVYVSGIGKVCRKEQSQAGGYIWMFNREYIRKH